MNEQGKTLSKIPQVGIKITVLLLSLFGLIGCDNTNIKKPEGELERSLVSLVTGTTSTVEACIAVSEGAETITSKISFAPGVKLKYSSIFAFLKLTNEQKYVDIMGLSDLKVYQGNTEITEKSSEITIETGKNEIILVGKDSNGVCKTYKFLIPLRTDFTKENNIYVKETGTDQKR